MLTIRNTLSRSTVDVLSLDGQGGNITETTVPFGNTFWNGVALTSFDFFMPGWSSNPANVFFGMDPTVIQAGSVPFAPIAGTNWITGQHTNGAVWPILAGGIWRAWGHRHAYTLPSGTVVHAHIEAYADNLLSECFINGWPHFTGGGSSLITDLEPSQFHAGGDNVLAFIVADRPTTFIVHNQPTSLNYHLTVTVESFQERVQLTVNPSGRVEYRIR